MATFLDHTIVPVRNREEAVEFYTRIFGFEDLGEVGPFLAVKVNDTLNLDFRQSDDIRGIHYASLWNPMSLRRSFRESASRHRLRRWPI